MRLLNINEVNGYLHQIIGAPTTMELWTARSESVDGGGRKHELSFPWLSSAQCSIEGNIELCRVSTPRTKFYVRKIISRVVNSRIELCVRAGDFNIVLKYSTSGTQGSRCQCCRSPFHIWGFVAFVSEHLFAINSKTEQKKRSHIRQTNLWSCRTSSRT